LGEQGSEEYQEATYRHVESDMDILLGACCRDLIFPDEIGLSPMENQEEGCHADGHSHHHPEMGFNDVVACSNDCHNSDENHQEQIVFPRGAAPGENQEGHDYQHQHDQRKNDVLHIEKCFIGFFIFLA
jgi:hypothetical protein